MKDDQSELFIVVDKDDNVIGYRSRYDCHHDKTLLHRAIAVLLYNDKDEILLQKRSRFKDLNPGKYSVSVGGHVTKGQSYEDAVKREMNEELGVIAPVSFVKKIIIRNKQESTMLAVFRGIHTGPFRPRKDEVESVDFFSVREIKKNE